MIRVGRLQRGCNPLLAEDSLLDTCIFILSQTLNPNPKPKP